MNVLLDNLDKLHTTPMGKDRIINNLGIKTDNVVDWCVDKIRDKNCLITKMGKNWYAKNDGCYITINSYSYTIITAHKC